jgi:dipeptidyl aminopeptidase/acylaminoacyl peptidase
VAALISEPQLPPEIFVVRDGEPRRLTAVNDELLKQVRLGEVEDEHFRSRDGTELEGLTYKPPAFQAGMRYPAILWIHGGPVSQFDHRFQLIPQLFAANGYLVVTVNPRGSSGYGQAFSAAIFAAWGEKDYEDVTAGVDHAIAQGYADPDRLGVGGWSYGGMLTNYTITQTTRFKGAVSGASMALAAANYGHDHYQREWELELGLPWRNRELWDRLSPLWKVEKITTPTLWIGGEQDWNVPVVNSEEMYQAMRRLGRDTALVVYPGESHGLQKPSYKQDRLVRFLGWYDRWVKGIKPAAAPVAPGG